MIFVCQVASAQVDTIYCVRVDRISVHQIDYAKFEGENLLSRITVNLSGDTIGRTEVLNTTKGRQLYQYSINNKDTLMFFTTTFDLEGNALYSITRPNEKPDTVFYDENVFGDRLYTTNRELIHYERDQLNRKVKEWYGDQINNYKVFEYNDSSQIIKLSYHNENNDYSYYYLIEYDSIGNIIKEASFDLQHLPLGINYYEYDKNSFLIREWGYVEMPFIPENRWEIKYEIIKCP